MKTYQEKMTLCTSAEEWRAAKHFRNTYFFDPNGIEDPYTWTFDHQDHKHFVYYVGADIVGYAHVQLWPEKLAALRIIAVNTAKRNAGYATRFMAQIEQWLREKGYQSLHTERSPSALGFYEKIGYVSMPFNDPDGYESDPNDTPLGKQL